MSIPLFGSTGALFNRLGKIGATIENLRSYQATQLAAFTDTTTGIVAQFDDESDIQALMGSSYITQLNSPGAPLGSLMQQMAIATANRMVFRDNPRINQTLEQQNTVASLEEIIFQMQQAGATVLAMTVTGTPSAFSGTGNGVINVSTKRPSDGLTLENSFSENVQFTCSSDSYSSTATAGNEGFAVTGVGDQTDPFAFNWPLGSNATSSVNAIDGNSDNSAGNILTNSGYESWTDNEPDNWEVTAGTGGTNIFRESSLIYDGEFAMRITGDAGGTLTSLRQIFGDSDGTEGEISPNVQVSVNVFVRRGGAAVSAGVWEIALVDENDDIVQDDAGVDNSYSIDLTSLTVSYASFTGVFRTPSIMPSSLYLRTGLTTALTSGVSVYFDKLSLGIMTQLYTSGPYFAVHAGSIPFEIGDVGTCLITNSRGTAGTLATFQTLMDNLFDMRNLDLLLPSSATPNISDSLIS